MCVHVEVVIVRAARPREGACVGPCKTCPASCNARGARLLLTIIPNRQLRSIGLLQAAFALLGFLHLRGRLALTPRAATDEAILEQLPLPRRQRQVHVAVGVAQLLACGVTSRQTAVSVCTSGGAVQAERAMGVPVGIALRSTGVWR